jgi:putative intracellular protease/amidase
MNATPTLGAIFYDDFELLDVYGPLEMFGALGTALRIVTVAEAAGPVRSTQGPATVAEYGFADCPPLDWLILPGGLGTMPQLENSAMLDFLRTRAARAELIMSVCTGSALLARAGLLDGRRATSNKQFFELARAQSAQVEWVEAARWVEDGPYVTASGVSAGIDMALGVIARRYGRERAESIAAYTEYTWHADASDDPFACELNKGDLPAVLAMLGRSAA